jgi:hypothetical protein
MGGQTTVLAPSLQRLRACVSLPRVKVVAASAFLLAAGAIGLEDRDLGLADVEPKASRMLGLWLTTTTLVPGTAVAASLRSAAVRRLFSIGVTTWPPSLTSGVA